MLNCGETDASHCRWIAGKLSEILGNEDDVVIELCFNLLEGARFVGSPSTIAVAAPSLLTEVIGSARHQGPPDTAYGFPG